MRQKGGGLGKKKAKNKSLPGHAKEKNFLSKHLGTLSYMDKIHGQL